MAAPDRLFDAEEILRVLVGHRVDFVVVGAVAVQAHGYIRSTRDLDIIVRRSMLNLSRLGEALADLEAVPRDGRGSANITDPHLLRQAPLLATVTRAGRLDILNPELVPGAARAYEDLRRAALSVELRGMDVAVLGFDDLIRMKKAAGRPQDLADIEALTRRDQEREGRAGEAT